MLGGLSNLLEVSPACWRAMVNLVGEVPGITGNALAAVPLRVTAINEEELAQADHTLVVFDRIDGEQLNLSVGAVSVLGRGETGAEWRLALLSADFVEKARDAGRDLVGIGVNWRDLVAGFAALVAAKVLPTTEHLLVERYLAGASLYFPSVASPSVVDRQDVVTPASVSARLGGKSNLLLVVGELGLFGSSVVFILGANGKPRTVALLVTLAAVIVLVGLAVSSTLRREKFDLPEGNDNDFRRVLLAIVTVSVAAAVTRVSAFGQFKTLDCP